MLSDALHIDQGIRGIMWHLHNLSRLEEQLPDNAALVMRRREQFDCAGLAPLATLRHEWAACILPDNFVNTMWARPLTASDMAFAALHCTNRTTLVLHASSWHVYLQLGALLEAWMDAWE
eukprot:s312_g7.t1